MIKDICTYVQGSVGMREREWYGFKSRLVQLIHPMGVRWSLSVLMGVYPSAPGIVFTDTY